MKNKYNLYDLYVMTVKIDNNYYSKIICELSIGLNATIKYKEVFTNTKINTTDENITKVEMLFDYYPPMSVINAGNFKISKKELLIIEKILNSTNNKTNNDSSYKKSKVYKKI